MGRSAEDRPASDAVPLHSVDNEVKRAFAVVVGLRCAFQLASLFHLVEEHKENKAALLLETDRQFKINQNLTVLRSMLDAL